MPTQAHRLFEQACRDLSTPKSTTDFPFDSASAKGIVSIDELLRTAILDSNIRERTAALIAACQLWDSMQRGDDPEGLCEFHSVLAGLLGLGEHALGIVASQGWISTVAGLWKVAELRRELDLIE